MPLLPNPCGSLGVYVHQTPYIVMHNMQYVPYIYAYACMHIYVYNYNYLYTHVHACSPMIKQVYPYYCFE